MSHRVEVEDGAEYPGERYIRCYEGRDAPNGEYVLFEGMTTEDLIEFLRTHEAIPR